MHNILTASAVAAGLMLGAALPASAMTAAPLANAVGTPSVTLVAGGCGPFRHRDFRGFCVPNGGYGYGPGWHGGWHRGWHRGWHHW